MFYKFSKTITIFKNKNDEWIIYNWLNSSYAILFDKEHPLYIILEKNIQSDKKQIRINSDDFCKHLEDLEYLLSNLILVENNSIVNKYINEKFEDNRNIKNKLSLILLPSGEACNFNCVYCYENHLQKEKMGDKHVDAIFNLVKETNSKLTHIEYFGGEPLLNASFIIKVNNRLKEWSIENKKEFIATATSNAYLLTPDIIDSLYSSNLLQYQITLDGLEYNHNKLRPLLNGKGTFDRIVNNLKYIISRKDLSNIKITIRCNYNEKTSTDYDIKNYLDFLENLIQSDKRFSVLFRHIGDYSMINKRRGNKDIICKKDNQQQLRIKYEIEAQKRGLILGEFYTCLSFGAASCYAAKPNHFVIFPDLSVKKCTVALNSYMNDVGHLTEDGKLILNENYNIWTKIRLNEKEDCKNCHFIAQCNSNSCPIQNINENSIICPPTKYNEIGMLTQFLKHIGEYNA